MAFASEFHMPGSYRYADGPSPNGQPLSHTMVRPPMSPSTSSSVYNIGRSTGSLFSDVSMATTPGAVGAKRKRMSRGKSTPLTDWTNMDHDGNARPDKEKSRYILAGQIQTPGAAPLSTSGGILEDSTYSDVNYRRELGPEVGRDDLDSPSMRSSGLHLDATSSTPARAGGWSTFALSAIGGVVGKVLQFCKIGAFKGFHAGGGTGYDMGITVTPTEGSIASTWFNEQDLPTPSSDYHTPAEHNRQANFLRSDYAYFPDYNELSSGENTPRPAIKRRQVSHAKETHDDLARNWVVVGETSPEGLTTQQQENSAASSFTRPASNASTRPSLRSAPRYSIPTTASTRRMNAPISRQSNTPSRPANTNRLPVRHTTTSQTSFTTRSPTASTASFRVGSPAMPSPSRIPLPANASFSTPNPFAMASTTSSIRTHRRDQSNASTASVHSPVSSSSRRKSNLSDAPLNSPMSRRKSSLAPSMDSPRLTAEAKQLAAKKMAADREADVKMEAFNRRLMDMIRQGKEALGTKVEVEQDGDVGMSVGETPGWFDDDSGIL
ncbi:hypothetical protein DL546_007735 [Coniochaeta pulveracea]|uniref:Uncharacterized protein n=1 Tax=Coniochaeta pulveracea TaxID=177199 RepID=A0A420YLV4_9PEZI|nr:hypothetical protein DL546_007735 [Coniochaeta pulveracea]